MAKKPQSTSIDARAVVWAAVIAGVLGVVAMWGPSLLEYRRQHEAKQPSLGGAILHSSWGPSLQFPGVAQVVVYANVVNTGEVAVYPSSYSLEVLVHGKWREMFLVAPKDEALTIAFTDARAHFRPGPWTARFPRTSYFLNRAPFNVAIPKEEIRTGLLLFTTRIPLDTLEQHRKGLRLTVTNADGSRHELATPPDDAASRSLAIFMKRESGVEWKRGILTQRTWAAAP